MKLGAESERDGVVKSEIVGFDLSMCVIVRKMELNWTYSVIT